MEEEDSEEETPMDIDVPPECTVLLPVVSMALFWKMPVEILPNGGKFCQYMFKWLGYILGSLCPVVVVWILESPYSKLHAYSSVAFDGKSHKMDHLILKYCTHLMTNPFNPFTNKKSFLWNWICMKNSSKYHETWYIGILEKVFTRTF